jgi:hypothetical protein
MIDIFSEEADWFKYWNHCYAVEMLKLVSEVRSKVESPKSEAVVVFDLGR